jgi:catechol 2,3-dioxygenase-like lactoylglutathione lyase family enzyme
MNEGLRCVAPFEVGLVAADLDALVPFYTRVLGLALLTDITVGEATSRAAGLARRGYRVVRLEAGNGDRIKLAQSLEPAERPRAPDFPMHRQGTAYLTFIVDDLQALHARLRDAGAAVRSDGVVVLRPGVSMLLATDPEGNWLEFVHYDDIASYRPARGAASSQ